jgi:hypothetical protein
MSRKLREAGGKAVYLKKLLQAHTNGEDSAQPELLYLKTVEFSTERGRSSHTRTPAAREQSEQPGTTVGGLSAPQPHQLE